jgi:signal transduction histidine kinase
MQKEFINIASHEMKTPTQAIVGFSDLIQKHPDQDEPEENFWLYAILDYFPLISRILIRLRQDSTISSSLLAKKEKVILYMKNS